MPDFDVSGTLKNMLEDGFTVRDAFSEKTDNPWDWGATEVDVQINTNTKEMITIDDAVGMNKSGLERAVRVNERSEASNEKQGKYGAGLPHAMMVDTRLNGSVQIISKMADMSEVFSINVDLKECVEKGIYSNKANEASVKQDRLFREHVKGDHGTLIVEYCDEQVIHELVKGFKSRNVMDNLLYELGVKYAQYLKQGKKIRIKIDNDYLRDVTPIDPLCLDVVTPDYQRVQCDVYQRGLGIAVACNINGKKQKVNTAKNNANHWNNFVLEEGMKLVSSFLVESVYRPEKEWLRIQKDVVAEIENDYVESEINEDCSETNSDTIEEEKINKEQKKYAHMGGLYLNRNLKNIHRETIEKPNSGDKSAYEYRIDSRHVTTFPVELDEPFGVQINKSHITYDNIHPEIKKAIEKIEYSFWNDKYKKYHVPLTPEEIDAKQKEKEAKQKEKEAKQKEKEAKQKEKEAKQKEKDAKKNKKISNSAGEVIIEKVEEVIVEKVEEVIVEKVDEVIVEKVVDEVIVEKVDEVIVEKVDEVIVEKVDEVIVEKVDDNREIVIEMVIDDTEVVIDNTEKDDAEEVIGKTRNMKGSKQTRLTVGQALGLINSNKLNEEVIDRIMPKYFDRCALDQFSVMYKYFTIEQKKNMLKEMIENKYRGIYEADVLGGAEILLSLM